MASAATASTRTLRKRQRVSYLEAELSEDEMDIGGGVGDDDDVGSDDDAEEAGRKIKRRKTSASSSSKPLPKKRVFPFLKLPLEIRDIIYSYCLVNNDGPQTIYLISGIRGHRRSLLRVAAEEVNPNNHGATMTLRRPKSSGEGEKQGDDRQQDQIWGQRHCALKSREAAYRKMNTFAPHLLRVSKQIFGEAASMLYRSSCFYFAHTAALFEFCLNVSPAHLALVKRMVIGGWASHRTGRGYNHTALSLLAGATGLESVRFDTDIQGYHYDKDHGQRMKALAMKVFRHGHYWLEQYGRAKGRYDAALDVVDPGVNNLLDQWRNGGGVWWNFREHAEESDESRRGREMFRDELRKLLKQAR